MISPLVMLNRSSVVMVHRKRKHTFDPGVVAPGSWNRAPGLSDRGSSRPLDLAAGGLDRSGGFFAGHRILHGEHPVRIALRRVRLAREHGAHQLVVAGAIFRCAPLKGYFPRQLEAA